MPTERPERILCDCGTSVPVGERGPVPRKCKACARHPLVEVVCGSCGEARVVEVRVGLTPDARCRSCAPRRPGSWDRSPRPCERCGIEYHPRRDSQRFCSQACRHARLP